MHRYHFLLIIIVWLSAACGGEGNTIEMEGSAGAGKGAAGKVTEITWIDSASNYGKILEGQRLSVSFRFRNTGSSPLIIESVTPSCGCTIADYPRQPIAPGKEGEISGQFDSNGREGLQHKELTVKSNTAPPLHTISFEVNVVRKPGAASNEQL